MIRLIRQSIISFKGTYSFYTIEDFVLMKILTPILQITLYIFIVSYALNVKNVANYVIANCILLCSTDAISGASILIKTERNYGTLSSIIASPENTLLIFFSKIIFTIIDGLSSVFVGLIFGILFFKLDISNINFPVFILDLVITAFSTAGLGFFIGAFGIIFTDINMLSNLVIGIVFIFSGANYDINKLPNALIFIPKIIPMTRGIIAGKLAFNGASLYSTSKFLMGEFLVGIIYFFISYFIIQLMEKKAMVDGGLDFY